MKIRVNLIKFKIVDKRLTLSHNHNANNLGRTLVTSLRVHPSSLWTLEIERNFYCFLPHRMGASTPSKQLKTRLFVKHALDFDYILNCLFYYLLLSYLTVKDKNVNLSFNCHKKLFCLAKQSLNQILLTPYIFALNMGHPEFVLGYEKLEKSRMAISTYESTNKNL